jgi:hypothetical protein
MSRTSTRCRQSCVVSDGPYFARLDRADGSLTACADEILATQVGAF